MIAEISPGLILIAGGLLAPLLPARLRPFLMVVLPIVAFAHLLALPHGEFGQSAGHGAVACHAARGQAQPAVRLRLSARRVSWRPLCAARSGYSPAGLRPDLCGQRAWRGFCRRSGYAVHFLGRHCDCLGVPDLGLAHRARLSRRDALYRCPDRLGRPASRRHPDPLPPDRLARLRRDRAHLAGRGADPARLWHQVRVSAAAQLAAGRLSGSDRVPARCCCRPSPPRSRSMRWRGGSPAPKSSCRSAPR